MAKVKTYLVFRDWRKMGTADSIYNTQLGVDLSLGDLHSGTTWEATVILPPDVMDELRAAWNEHHAYAVFEMLLREDLEHEMDSPADSALDAEGGS